MKPAVKKILTISLTCLLVVYLVVVCNVCNNSAKEQMYAGLDQGKVLVDDPENIGFVTSEVLTKDLSSKLNALTEMRIHDVDLGALQTYISGLERIESAQVTRLANNKIRIKVKPLEPVARVWNLKGGSYYINRDGKRIPASRHYKVDVPQLYGEIPKGASPTVLLPLLDYLNSDADMNKMITMISAQDSANIILVPAIRGHVINLGKAVNIADKFNRLRRFYAEVMPKKGWEFYDTISLKWDNQIVATRRKGKLPKLGIEIIQDLEGGEANEDTALTTPEEN